MDHHDHDLDLVAALAEGRSTDRGRAEELVRTCDVCADAYRSHVAVLEAVSAEAAPRLDDLERRRLRGAVWDQLDSDAAAASPVEGPPIPWWYRIAPVAAALVVVVGVAVVLPGSGDDAADDGGGDAMTVLEDATQEDATQMAETTAADSDRVDESADDTPADDTAADDVAAAGASDTTAATEETSDITSGLEGGTGETFSRAPTFETTTAELDEAQRMFAERSARRPAAMELPAEVAECLQGDPDLDGPFLAAESALVDGGETLFVAQGEPGEVTRVIVYAAGTCEVLASHVP